MYRRGDIVTVKTPDTILGGSHVRAARFWYETYNRGRVWVVLWHERTAYPLLVEWDDIIGRSDEDVPPLPGWAT